MTKKLLMLTCASGAMTLLWAGASYAATATATDTAASTDNGATSVTELVVTAERREQSLQKVPVAVSVFTGSQRDTIGINTVADVTNFAPGFVYDPGNVHAFIRGIGRQSVNVTDDQRVANYEDDFYVYSPYGLDKSSLFLSQEQIERGPQNVGGRNAAGGSIDMISVRPTDQPYAELRATFGNFGTYEFEGAASGQVAPGLDVRLAGYFKNQNNGFYNNLIGPSEGSVVHEWYAEGQVDWKPNDKFEFWARTFFSGWNNRGDAGSRLGFYQGSWDETTLTDANGYVGGGLFLNPNFGYAATTGGNPAANAALLAARAAGLSTDPVPLSVNYYQNGITNNPSLQNVNNFAAPLSRTVKLNNYDDFNYVFTFHFDGFDFKYNGGIQGYNYYLNDPGDGPDGNTDVQSFTLPGNTALAPLNTAFGGGPFPGCPSAAIPFACGVPATAGGPATALAAGSHIPTGNLVINPLIHANYVEDDYWTAHDFTFQSTNDSALQWTVGAFFYFQHYNQPYELDDPNQSQLSTPSYTLPGITPLVSSLCAIPPATTGTCGLQITPGVAAPANPHNYLGYFQYEFDVRSYAGYGQTSYKLNDQWRITGDLRYNYDDKTGTENARYVAFSSALIDGLVGVLGPNVPALDVTPSQTCLSGNPANCNSAANGLGHGVASMGVILPSGFAHRSLALQSSAVTGGAGIEWTPTPDIFTYFRYGRGYESPSFNAGEVVANPGTAPEYLNSYEIGYKETFGHALLIDTAFFYYDYDNFQAPISVTNGGVTQGEFVNVPKAVSEGAEIEAYWTPVRDLLVTASYSYDHTAVLTGCTGTVNGGALTPAPGAFCLLDTNDLGAIEPGANPFPGQTTASRDQSVKGNPLPDAPENKFAVDVAYTWHFTPGSFTLSGSYAWRDTQDGSLFKRFYYVAPSWDDVSMRGLWKGTDDRYEVIVYVKNLFNNLEYTTGFAGAGLAGGADYVGINEVSGIQLNPPRTFGVELHYKFF